MTTNIMLNCVFSDAKVWWRFEYVDFIGYTNQEKLKVDEVYGNRLNAWWMFSTNNPRMIFSKNVLFDYYRNLEELIGLHPWRFIIAPFTHFKISNDDYNIKLHLLYKKELYCIITYLKAFSNDSTTLTLGDLPIHTGFHIKNVI